MCRCLFVFFFKQKTAYEMRISDWSSDMCSSDLDAWLALSPFGPEIKHLMTAWNTANTHDSQQWLDRALQPAEWAAWQAGAASWCRKLAGQMDLAHSLTAFCTQQRRKS